MKTYILGAGASRHAGYPLANRFDKDLGEWVRSKPDPSSDALSLVDFLAEISADRNFEDALEAVTSFINTPQDQLSADDRSLRCYASQQLSQLTQTIRTWFLELQSKKSSVYDQFATRIVGEGDSIISFNYDVALEGALRERGWELRDGYGFLIDGFNHSSLVQLLKLHGSVNWMAVPFQGMKGFFQFNGNNSLGSRPVIMDYDARLLGYQSERDSQWPGPGTAGVSPLILPARTKKFFFRTTINPYEWVDFWDALWQAAARSLQNSSHVFICGYSLPSADERARQLIFSSTSKSAVIEVSCGSNTNRIANDFRNAGFANVFASEKTHFEDWVQSIVMEMI